MNDIYYLIESKSSIFSKNDKFISKNLLQNPQIFLDNDINDLANILFVSPSSISRFCKKINIDGFKELKYIIANNLEKQNSTYNESTSYDKIYNNYVDSLNGFRNNFNEKAYLKTANLIIESKNIYILGIGSSGFLAQDFSMRLARLGFNTKAITDNDFMIMQTALASKKDLFIAISSQGVTPAIVKALEKCEYNKIKTILITEHIGSIASLKANMTLLTPRKNNFNFIISNQFSQLLVCDIIISYIVAKNDKYLNNYNKTIDVYSDLIK